MPRPAPTVRFPLWSKLGGLFGSLVAVVLATAAAADIRWDREVELEAQRDHLENLASTIAVAIDGQAFRSIDDQADMEGAEYREISHLLNTAMETGSMDWVGTGRREDGRWEYVAESDLLAPMPVGYPIFDAWDARNEAWDEKRVVFVPELTDEWGVWRAVLAPILDGDEVVGVVEVEVDAQQDALRASWQFRRALYQVLAAIAVCLVVAIVFARALSKNVQDLTDAALAVATGDLGRDLRVRTHDEIGVLAHAFGVMVHGLKEREHIKDTFGRFLNKKVVERALNDPRGIQLGGEKRVVTVLMSDLRGFTAMSQELGPERLVQALNRYFSRMSRAIDKNDGTMAEILGDGILVFFGAPTTGPDDALRAVRCALDMHAELKEYNRDEGRELQMGVGICTGEVVVGNIGSEQQMKYGVVGDAINLAARLESCTVGNQVLVDAFTRDAAGPELSVDEPVSLSVKGRKGGMIAYPVRKVGDREMPEDVTGTWRVVGAPAWWWEIEGKQLSRVAHEARLVAVSEKKLKLATHPLPPLRASIKVAANLGDGRTLEDVYATVAEVDAETATLLVTSASDDERVMLRHLVRG